MFDDKQLEDRQCAYEPGALWVIDMMNCHAGTLRGAFSSETIEEMRKRYPKAVVGTVAQFREQSEAACREAPKEIAPETFAEALEVLPPLDWHRRDGTETFKASEFFAGRMTSIYCRIGLRCFHLLDVHTLTHDEIVAKCRLCLTTMLPITTVESGHSDQNERRD